MCIIYSINIFKFLQVGKNYYEAHFSFYREQLFKNRKKTKSIKQFQIKIILNIWKCHCVHKIITKVTMECFMFSRLIFF